MEGSIEGSGFVAGSVEDLAQEVLAPEDLVQEEVVEENGAAALVGSVAEAGRMAAVIVDSALGGRRMECWLGVHSVAQHTSVQRSISQQRTRS